MIAGGFTLQAWAVSDAIAERNAQALEAWRQRRAEGALCTDPARSADERELFNRWLEQRRDQARGWIDRGMFFRRQAG